MKCQLHDSENPVGIDSMRDQEGQTLNFSDAYL